MHFWIQNKGSCWICNLQSHSHWFDYRYRCCWHMQCTIRSMDQSIPLYGKSIAHQNASVYAFADLMISFSASTHHNLRRKQPRQHPNAARHPRHKFFRLHTMSCSKYCRKREQWTRKTSAWCMISICRGRWQMTNFNRRWCNSWFGLVWLVIWRCKKVNDCLLHCATLSLLSAHTLNLTLLACACTCRPWAVWQRKRHALGHSDVHGESNYHVKLPSSPHRLHLLNRSLMPQSHSLLSPQDDTATSFKQVHRTQPILNYNPSILDHHPTMTHMSEKKERKRSMAFGLPREKVREFMKSHNLMHWKVPRSTPTLYP